MKKRPLFRAYSAPETGPWTEVGAAWETRRDGYLRLPLSAMPLDGVLILVRDDVDPRFQEEEPEDDR